MRNAILVSVLAAVLVTVSATAFAGPPLAGTYKSSLGDFDEGTASSSWPAGGPGGYLGAGNVFYGQSAAGGVFTGDWLVSCPLVTAVIPNGGVLIGGTGNLDFIITYAGGYIQLGGPGTPWNGGDPSYVGNFDTFAEFRTVQYVANVIKGATSDFVVSAHLQGYAQTCMTWGVGNGVLRGGTGFVAPLQNVKPAGYPDYHNAACAVAGTVGHWDDVRDLTISIDSCPVPTQPSTWGQVKSIYRK